MINETLMRLARLFSVSPRIQDLNLLTSIKLHFLSYGKLGDMNERAIRDMENKYVLELTKWDNHWEGIITEAINKRMPPKETEMPLETTKNKKKENA